MIQEGDTFLRIHSKIISKKQLVQERSQLTPAIVRKGWLGRKVDVRRDYAIKLIKKVPVDKILLCKTNYLAQQPVGAEMLDDNSTLKIFEYLTQAAKGHQQRLEHLQRELENDSNFQFEELMDVNRSITEQQRNTADCEKQLMRIQNIQMDVKEPPKVLRKPHRPKTAKSSLSQPHQHRKVASSQLPITLQTWFKRLSANRRVGSSGNLTRQVRQKHPPSSIFEPSDFFAQAPVHIEIACPPSSQKRVCQILRERTHRRNHSEGR